MFISRIRVFALNNDVLFDAVLRELPDLCDSFTCYPKEQMFIVQSSQSAVDLCDSLRMRSINTEQIGVKML